MVVLPGVRADSPGLVTGVKIGHEKTHYNSAKCRFSLLLRYILNGYICGLYTEIPGVAVYLPTIKDTAGKAVATWVFPRVKRGVKKEPPYFPQSILYAGKERARREPADSAAPWAHFLARVEASALSALFALHPLRYSSAITVVFLLRYSFAIPSLYLRFTAAKPPLLR